MGARPDAGGDEVGARLEELARAARVELELELPAVLFGEVWVARRWRATADGAVASGPLGEAWPRAAVGSEPFAARLEGRWIEHGGRGPSALLAEGGRALGVLRACSPGGPLDRTAHQGLRVHHARLVAALAHLVDVALAPGRAPGVALRAVVHAGELGAVSPPLAEALRDCVAGGPCEAWRALELGERGFAARRVVGLWGVSSEPLVGASGAPQVLVSLTPASLPPCVERDRLSPRQREVASFAAAGATIAEIARATRCAPETVKSHLKAIYQALGVGCRVELAAALAARRESESAEVRWVA